MPSAPTVVVALDLRGPDTKFVPGSRVTLRAVGAVPGEGPVYDPETLQVLQGLGSTLLVDTPVWSAALRPNAALSPTNNFYEATVLVPGRPKTTEQFVVPAPVTTTTMADYIVGDTTLSAPAAGFAVATASAPQLLSFGGRLLTYTGTTLSAFTGVSLLSGSSSGDVASGSTVAQAWWLPLLLDNPPADLPTLLSAALAALNSKSVGYLATAKWRAH